MMDFCRKNKGYISILLCILLLPMVTYATMIIDATRLQSVRVEVQSAGDLAINAAMSEYDQLLEDMYGLFANAKSKEEIEPAIRQYFEETISGKIGYSNTENGKKIQQFANELTSFVMQGENVKEDDLTNFLQVQLLQVDDEYAFKFEPIESSAISNPNIMKAQIIDYMKYKGPVSVGNNLMNKLGFLKDTENQSKAVQQKIELTEKIADMGDPMKDAYNAIDSYNKNANEYNKYTEESIYNLMDEMNLNLENMSKLFLCVNYINKLDEKYGIDAVSCYSDLNIEGIDLKLKDNWKTDNELNRIIENSELEKITDVSNAVQQLNKLIDPINEIFYLDVNTFTKNIDQFSDMEKIYGFIEYNFNDENMDANVNINVSIAKLDDYKATYGNLSQWNSIMSGNDYDSMFELQLELIPKVKEYSEYKAYHEYFLEIKRLYDRKYDEYIKIYKKINGEDADISSDYDYIKFAKIYNLLSKVEEKWISGNTYTEYNTFLSRISKSGKYFFAADKYGKKADDEFVKYYLVIKKLESTTKTAVDKLNELIKLVGEVETKANSVKANIDSTVEDDSVRSQMSSSVDTLKKSVKKEDAENLKSILEEYHKRFEVMKNKMEEVSYFSTEKDKLYGPFGDNFGNITYSDRTEYQFDIDEKNIKSIDNLYTLFISKYNNDVFGKGTNIIVGNDCRSLVTEFKGNAQEIIGNTTEETFFNVLKNTAKAEGTKDENEKNNVKNVKSITDVNIDDNGKPNDTNNVSVNISASEKKEENENKVNIPEGASGNQEAFNKAVNDVNSGSYGSGYGKASKIEVGDDESDDKKHKENAKNGKNNLSTANDLLHKIAKIIDEFKNDVYLEEYFTEMFTCQTDKKLPAGKLQLINGYSNDPSMNKFLNTDNAWYGSEIEYILWGNPDINSNLKTTEMTIFLLRFAINSIYAFTASDIQSLASTMAEILVGWSIVLVPVVQVCIVLAIALTESSLDLQLLLAGEDVPLIKDSVTFICSPTGLANGAADKIIDVAGDKITDKVDATIDDIDNLANKKIEDCESQIDESLKNYLTQQTNSITSSISSQFTTPLVAQITPILSRVNETASNAEAITREAINDVFDTIENNLNSLNDGLIKQYSLKIYREQAVPEKENIINSIVKKIEESGMQTSPSSIRDMIDQKVNSWVSSILKQVQEEIKTTIISPMKDEIMKHKDEAATNIKSYIHDEIEKAGQQLSGTIKSEIKDVASQVAEKSISTKSTSVAAKITMNYKEYCKIFMFIGLIDNNESNMLKRAAVLMQLNVNYAVKGGNSISKIGSSNFHINQAYTLFYVGAEMKMGTLFPWSVEIKDDGTNTDINLDLSNLGDNYITLKYGGITGY